VLFQHSSITVDLHDATISTPDASVFTADQSTRAFTHRVDLTVNITMPDTDGDGLPDWWEDANSLNKQLVDNNSDPDGDGLSNTDEFYAGSNPLVDNRVPELLTDSILVYHRGLTGITLNVVDSDSLPQNIVYTIKNVPASGSLLLGESTPLMVNSTFTHADIVAACPLTVIEECWNNTSDKLRGTNSSSTDVFSESA